MPIYLRDLEQGTDEWRQVRCGIATASAFDRIVTPAKCQLSAQSDGYLRELLAEWVSGEPADTFSNQWTERGSVIESEARDYYAFARDVDVAQVGFVYLDDKRMVGASPDGLPGDGLLEIKCPKPSTHIGYLLKGEMPNDYRAQVQGSLMVTERPWCDFLSYCPNIPPLLIRVERDEAYITKLRTAVQQFVEKLEAGRDALRERGFAANQEAA